MRWGIVLMLLLLQAAVPVAPLGASAQSPEARSASGELIGLDEVVVHCNELIEVSFAVQNTGSDTQTFVINATSVPAGISISGLPLTHTIEAGYLKSLKFNLSGEATAALGTVTLPIELSTLDNQSWSLEQNLSVIIAPYSRLDFGVQGVSSFISDAGARTSVAVNITNNGSYTDDVTFNLYTQSGWNWGWIMNETEGVNAFESLEPGQLAYVYIWIDVPEVVDGAPLAGTGPRFQLKAVSGVDRAISQWSFDLLAEAYKNASIDTKGDDLVLDPGANGRVEVNVRNVGNTPNKLNITLQAIDEQGIPITGESLDDRIVRNGWTMALFSGLETVDLQPNESRTIEIGFQAPGDYFGEIDVRVRVFAEGAPLRVRTVDVGASIDWQRNATVALVTDECQSLLPNGTCTASIRIENTGNARDTFTTNLVDAPDHLTTSILQSSISLDPFESATIEVVQIEASSEALAFTTGDVTVDVRLGGTQNTLNLIKVPTKIAPVIDWIFEDITESIDANGRLSITMTARNEGNAVDGLLVQLQSSHSTKMSFIPPFIAVYEEGIEYPRSYEITDIPIGFNFTIEAWVDLPQDQSSNGTVYVNTSVRSQFAPDEPFTHTSTGAYLGVQWQPVDEDESWVDLSAIYEATVAIFSAWLWVIVSVVISVVIIQKAISARKTRTEEQALYNQLHEPKTPEVVQDWMQKFSEKAAPEAQPMTLAVSTEHFQEAFTNRAGSPTPAPQPVAAAVHEAAAQALDAQDNQRTIAIADQLLSDISVGNVARPVGSSDVLPDVEVAQNMTVRHDPQQILDPKDAQSPPQIPLPSAPTMIDLDDLDV